MIWFLIKGFIFDFFEKSVAETSKFWQ